MSRNVSKKMPYQCIRCGYETGQKGDIKKHFYKTKKLCPASLNNLELTEEIREFIIDNRRYHVPTKAASSNVNNYLYQMVINMNPSEKLSKLLDFRGEKLLDFDNGLYDKYSQINDRLENDNYKYGYQLGKNDFLNAVDQATGTDNQFNSMNVLYDPKTNKISIYRNPKWEYYLLESGINEVIRTIKSNFLDTYEQYLVKKLSLSSTNLVQLQSRLDEYFKFIISFDLQPYVKAQKDQEILGVTHYNDSNEYSVETRFMKLYEEIKKQLSRSQINKTKKEVVDIIKLNGKCNLEKLNQEIMVMINADQEFKTSLGGHLLVETKVA
jgi:hypothetical protein